MGSMIFVWFAVAHYPKLCVWISVFIVIVGIAAMVRGVIEVGRDKRSGNLM
ncbi:hypothetical protein K353_05818 [Kitasatospora sp. SolWspMP-SS2h]|nr:hypothetical protein K353_05818 [Kitasatospora sp. SolWspMP-SS2h]